MLRAAWIGGLVAMMGGCLISPAEETHAQLALSLEMPWELRAGAEGTFNPWDGQGLFRLERFPKYLRVAVEVDDYELASGSWPDPDTGVGEGEDGAGEAVVELAVAAGKQRRVRVLGYHVEYTGEVRVYKEQEALELELSAGQLLEASVEVVEHTYGTIAATVRCRQGSIAGWTPKSIAAVDARAQVVRPPIALEPGLFGALGAELTALPVDRPHWARILLADKDSDAQTFVDVRKPTFTVTKAGETLPVNLVIPCGL